MKLTLVRSHTLDLATLRARIEARVQHWDALHPALQLRRHYHWHNETHASAEYRGGNGTLALSTRDLQVELTLPFIARPFRDRIQHFLESEAAVVLAPAVAS